MFSIGADEDFQHQSYASAPGADNPPYNPQFELNHLRSQIQIWHGTGRYPGVADPVGSGSRKIPPAPEPTLTM